MGASTMLKERQVSVAEYLASSYEPDMDYVDGVLEDRNVGEKDHAKALGRVYIRLSAIGDYFVTIETRTRVSPRRFRVPDVAVYPAEPDEQVLTVPPLLVVEILSLADRMGRVQIKLEDYVAMGCPSVWVLNPKSRKAFQYDGTSLTEVRDELAHPTEAALRLRLADVFPS